MKTLRRDWYQFWFAPVSPVPLGIFRLIFGLIVLAYAALLFPDRFLWFSDQGALPLATAHAYNGSGTGGYRLSPLDFRGFHLGSLEIPGADYWLTPFFVIFLMAALGLALGCGTRLCAILVFVCINALHNRNAAIHNSGDTVMLVMTGYLVLAPAGAACSVDRLWRIFRGREGDEPPPVVPWAQRLIQIQVSIIYLQASLSKVTGSDWQNGTAVYFPIHLTESRRFPMWGLDGHHFGSLWIINLLTWGSVAIELAMATFVWVPRLRLYVLAAATLLHLGIEYTLNIPLFSFLMIASYITFTTGDDWKRLLAWERPLIGLTPLRLVYDGECDFCKSALLAVRFLDVFRRITFLDYHDPAQLARAPGVRVEDAEQAAIALNPAGRQFAGFDAFRAIAWQMPLPALFAPLLYVPGVPQIGRRVYQWVKENRNRLPVAPRYKAPKPAPHPPTLSASETRVR